MITCLQCRLCLRQLPLQLRHSAFDGAGLVFDSSVLVHCPLQLLDQRCATSRRICADCFSFILIHLHRVDWRAGGLGSGRLRVLLSLRFGSGGEGGTGRPRDSLAAAAGSVTSLAALALVHGACSSVN
jgi:hypothetical protein